MSALSILWSYSPKSRDHDDVGKVSKIDWHCWEEHFKISTKAGLCESLVLKNNEDAVL